MSKKSYRQSRLKRDIGRFMTIPVCVLESEAYIQASAYAKVLLWDLFMQYRGDNNGDLCVAWKVMRRRGWKSEATLDRAKKQLIHLGLIVETRKGARPNKASLYAVTWCDLDACGGKLDISLHAFPRSAYKLRNTLPPLKPRIRSLATEAVVPGA
jgi:hypothetical protein